VFEGIQNVCVQNKKKCCQVTAVGQFSNTGKKNDQQGILEKGIKTSINCSSA